MATAIPANGSCTTLSSLHHHPISSLNKIANAHVHKTKRQQRETTTTTKLLYSALFLILFALYRLLSPSTSPSSSSLPSHSSNHATANSRTVTQAPSSKSAPPPKMPPPQSLILAPLTTHTATIIFSHGLGDTAHGWISFAQSMRPRFPYVKWVLPTA